MIRAVLLAAALLLAPDASAADPKATDAKKADPAANTPKARAEALKKKKEEEEAAKSGKSKSAPKKPNDSPQVAAMKQARAQLVYAAEACQNPSKCDMELRDDAVERFKAACRECDSVDRCDAERAAILSGDVPRGSGLCAPKP